jgi:hypothetical protein
VNRHRVEAVLRALWKALRREQKSLMEFPANNLYYAAVAFLVMMDPVVMLFVGVIVGVVLFFPLSSDPLRRIPPSRFQLWPLSDPERRLVRVISPWLNPMTWIVAAFALWRGVSLGLGLLAAAVFLIGFLAPSVKFQGKGRASALLPQLPPPLGQLIRKNLRQLLTTLDFYCALIVGGAALGYRLAGLLPPEAYLPGTLLTTLAISTCAQTLFGLDGRPGITRYRLLPLRGWQILLAKDAAYMLVSVALTLSLAPLAGVAAALAALATARKPAIHENRAQIRWRLQAGTNFGNAIFQILAIIGAATAVHLYSPLFLIPVIAIWLGSLWWGGREIERKLRTS